MTHEGPCQAQLAIKINDLGCRVIPSDTSRFANEKSRWRFSSSNHSVLHPQTVRSIIAGTLAWRTGVQGLGTSPERCLRQPGFEASADFASALESLLTLRDHQRIDRSLRSQEIRAAGATTVGPDAREQSHPEAAFHAVGRDRLASASQPRKPLVQRHFAILPIEPARPLSGEGARC